MFEAPISALVKDAFVGSIPAPESNGKTISRHRDPDSPSFAQIFP